MSREINHRNFKAEVVNCDRVVVADFWARWCTSCILLETIIDELEAEMGPEVKFVKVNVDESPNLSEKLNISSLPTVLIIKGSRIKKVLKGSISREKLRHEIKKVLD